MTFSKNTLYKTLLLIAVFLSSILAAKQIVVKYQGQSKSVMERFNWAINEASDLDSYWVGYQFDRMMNENSWIGSWSSDDDENRPSLASILGEPEPEGFRDWSLEQTAKMALKGLIEKEGSKEKVRRKVAVLLRYKRHTSNPRELAAVEVSNTSLRVRLKNKPLYWLGNCTQAEGLSLLKQVMAEDPVNRVREDLITAYAMHDSVPELANMLNTIATTDKSSDVREKAVFWIGQQQRPEALEMLKKIVRSNDVDDVREKAVFSISQIKSDAALD
ncbi:MAG: HEAT repeat domain-containing protein, partial [Calditrichota bacterium]